MLFYRCDTLTVQKVMNRDTTDFKFICILLLAMPSCLGPLLL